jgi:hypothetical protein
MLQSNYMGNTLNFHEKNRQKISPRLVAKTDDAFLLYTILILIHSTYGMSLP